MEQNTKTILLAVLIILIAIVSFNFTEMTGEATKGSKAVVKIISPVNKIVQRGETINVKVTPGSNGVDNRYMWIYRENGARMQNSKAWICGRYGNVCETSSEVVYNTLGTDNPVVWPLGKYIIKVKEHNGNYVTDTFTLVG